MSKGKWGGDPCYELKNLRKRCFGCDDQGVCTVLIETSKKKPCPFYKTRQQAEESRKKAEERLKRIGLYEAYKAKYEEG